MLAQQRWDLRNLLKTVHRGGNTVTVDKDTVVNADPIGTGDTPWNVLAISPYTINVAKGAKLVLNDLITYNPQITGEGDIVINKTNVSSTYQGAYGHGIVLTSIKNYLPGMSENVSIKANSLTINVGIEGAPWTAKGIMVPYDERGTVNIELTDKLDIHARSAAIHTEGNTETPINITAKNVEMLSDGDWVIHNNGASSINITATEAVNMESKASGGITNNSTGAINISSKEFTLNSVYDSLSAGSGDIIIETEGDNTLTATRTGEPSQWGTAGNGVHAKNAKIQLISTTGNNTITAGLDGLQAANWTGGACVEAPNAKIEVIGVNNIIKAERNGAYTLGGNIEVTSSNDNLIDAETGLYADKGNVIFDAGNNTVINATDKAMYATNHGVAKVLSEKLTQMTGDVVANSFGSATAGLDSKESYLLGAVHTDGGWTDNSKTDLSFTNGATWYLTDNSNVSDLTLDNGIVDLTEQVKNNKKVNAYKVSIDRNLNGSGLFKLDLTYLGNNVERYMRGDNSDFIYIYGGDNSEQNIEFAINDANLGAMKSGDKLYFARVHNDGATFGQGETIRKANEDSIYDNQYRIESEEHKEVAQLSLDDRAASNPDGIDEEKPTGPSEPEIVPMYSDWYITCEKGGINPNGETPVQSYNAGFALWRDDDTLLKRLGELRYTNDEGGVWTRVIGKKLEDNRALGFNTHAKTVQVGYDRKDVQEDGSGTWRKGIAIGHTWADTSFSGGEGKNNYTDLSIYATNIRKHDHYLDLVARFGRINSDYDTVYGDHGEFDNWAGSLSAEYGRKKQMNEDNWFIEPQAQLTYSYMWGDSYTTRKGVRVEQDNADSLVGRAGFIISKELESERKYPNRYYAKAFIMHEFLDGGDNTVSLGSDRFYAGSDFKDTWYVVGVGANADMGNQCTFYFDAEKNFKAHVKMPYRIEAGFRWEF